MDKINLNDEGIVTNEGIHDATITEIRVSGESDSTEVIIHCRSELGVVFIFKFNQVKLFDVCSYGKQNVINDFYLLSNTDAESFVKELADVEKYTSNGYTELNDSIKRGEVTLARFVPSVGADITIICKTVEML